MCTQSLIFPESRCLIIVTTSLNIINLAEISNPKTVAVIGATDEKGSVGYT
jgi:hypothetical protein